MKQRRGTSKDLYVSFLQAVPVVGSTPAALWVKVITIEPTWTETLLLCGAAGCASKVGHACAKAQVVPPTLASVHSLPIQPWALNCRVWHAPHPALTQKSARDSAYMDFVAASAKFAMVWERVTTAGVTASHLQHFDGTKWTTKLKLTVPSPSAKLSLASAMRAASLLITESATFGSLTVITHTWNGASWPRHTNITVPNAQIFDGRVHSLNSGSALLQLRTSLSRLA